MGRLLLVLVLLAAACGAERPTLEGPGGVAREVTPDDIPASTTEVSGSLGLRPEPLTVRLAVPGTWSGDPAEAGPASITNRVLADLLFEGLTSIDAAGDPVPGLAVRWDVSPDRLEWSFVLPAGLSDGQGERVTATEVADSLDRVAARGSVDQAATALVAVTGWRARMGGDADSVSGIVVVDDTTLKLVLDRPFELLPVVLASPAFGIMVVHPDGTTGTTGRFRATEDPGTLEPVSASSAVTLVELVPDDGDVLSVVASGAVDWAVVPPGRLLDDLPGDVIREPLDMRVGFAIRLPDRSERLGLAELIDPILVAAEVPGLSALVSLPIEGDPALPSSLVIDAPEGRLAEVAEGAKVLLEAGGVDVELRVSSPTDFALRVASGEALVYPVVIAGGTGSGGATLRSFAPGGIDDILWVDAEERIVLADRAMSELDPAVRDELLEALERQVVESASIRIVGRWEVTVSIGPRLSGLRQRADGTLDLSRAAVADE